ncbi:MAG: hypothetical protein ACYDBB_04350 [Armatimonadota bacterium]
MEQITERTTPWSESELKAFGDLGYLRSEAGALLALDRITPHAGQSGVEELIRRAHQVLDANLGAIEQLQQTQQEVDVLALFGDQVQEKLAAILFLTKHKLRDIVYQESAFLEHKDCARDVATFVEILYRAGAAEGLGVIYDYAAAHLAENAAPIWQKICLRCLHLLALLPHAHPYVLLFLREREGARRQIEQMMASPDPAMAQTMHTLGQEYVAARKSGQLPDTLPIPAYVALYRQYELGLPEDRALGLTSLLSAAARIQRALAAMDDGTVINWLVSGSPAAAAAVFRMARAGLPTMIYAGVLKGLLLFEEDVHPVRLAAAVLELGGVNRTASPQNGHADINSTLVEVAMTEDSLVRSGVGRLAVHELGTVDAFNDILGIMEDATVLEIATEGMRVMANLRRLNLAESTLSRRITLVTTYEEEKRKILAAQATMEAAFSAPDEDTAQTYLDRLRELNALPELKQLCQKKTAIATLAQRTMTQMKLDTTVDQVQ